jgi:hypothetical protein
VEGSDILQTIAEIAIALTGFTGIVVALGGRTRDGFSGFVMVRFRILLVASLAALAFALLPILLHHLAVPAAVVWSLSSAVVAAFMVPIVILDVRSFRQFSNEIPPFERRAAPVIAILGSALWVAQVANATFLHAFGPFLAAPLWFLGFSAFSFSRLLLTSQENTTQ